MLTHGIWTEYNPAGANPQYNVLSQYHRRNAPAFKTPKLLRGRELEPGFGAQRHQDGFNVLSGDYTTRWCSDEEKRIIYRDLRGAAGSYGGHTDHTGGGYQTDSGLSCAEIMVGCKFDSLNVDLS